MKNPIGSSMNTTNPKHSAQILPTKFPKLKRQLGPIFCPSLATTGAKKKDAKGSTPKTEVY